MSLAMFIMSKEVKTYSMLNDPSIVTDRIEIDFVLCKTYFSAKSFVLPFSFCGLMLQQSHSSSSTNLAKSQHS